MDDVVIELRNVDKSYSLESHPWRRLWQQLRGRTAGGREFHALRHVNLRIRRGEVVGVIGRNGAGKSTLLQVVCGVLRPSSGERRVHGRVAALLELGAGFNPELTGRENVRLNGPLLGLSAAEVSRRMEDIVEFAGIQEFIDQPVRSYSSGMFVRLAFAMATSMDPDILVVDEALSVGDGAFARKSYERIMSLKEKGTTILFCSHSMFQVESLCTRAIWIDGGRIRFDGPAHQATVEYSDWLARLEQGANELPAQAQHFESAAAAITRLVVLQPPDGTAFRHRVDNLTVEIEFRSDPKIPCPTLGVVIHGADGRAVSSAGNWIDGVTLVRDDAGCVQVTLEFPALPLLKGHYTVSAYVLCERSINLYAAAEYAASLDVVQDHVEQGVVTLPRRWIAGSRAVTAREFAFPLNVYGALLEWTQGRLDCLHYGLFDSADEPVARAQERASERLWAQMPPRCRVLEVGIGVGTTLARLRELGYDALGVTPEPAQAALARQRHGAHLAVEIARLEDLGSGHGPFDLLLLQESAQYIEPLALFKAAERLLARERATLLVMDEFALRRDSEGDAGLHLLPQFLELARSHGWRLVHEEDVSAQASITLDILLELTARHRQRLQDELGVSSDDLDALERSNRRYRDYYRRGVYGYRVLRFERGATAGLPAETAAVQTVRDGMIAAMATLWPQADQVLMVGSAPTDVGGRRLQASELKDFNREAGTWQALVLWECAAQMDAIGIFSAAAKLLAPAGASLLVSDRFVSLRHADDLGDCHQLAHFVALAERCGWGISHRVEEAIGNGQVHAFLRFDRRPGSVEALRRVDERSAPAMRELFRCVFGQEMSPEHWQWKYGEGRGVGVALERDGRLVAHFAGLSRRVLRFGAAELAWQIGDVMVAPDANRSLVRNGPLRKVSTTFFENELGWGRSHRFGFGFPNERAFKVAERLGLYSAVDTVVRIRWPARAAPGVSAACHWLAADGRFSAAEADGVNVCWRAMAPAFADAVLGVRDAAWLRYRYLERPHITYRLAGVQDPMNGAPLGVIVMREHETHLDLLDMVGPPAAFAALVGAARAHAAASGRQHVELWLTRSQLHRLAAADLEAAEVHNMGITVPANVHTPGPPVEELRDRWFLLGGDADFT